MVSWLQNRISHKVEGLKLSPTFSISSLNAIPNGKKGTQLISSHNWMVFFPNTHNWKQWGFHSSLVLLRLFYYSSRQMYCRQQDNAPGIKARRQAGVLGVQAEVTTLLTVWSLKQPEMLWVPETSTDSTHHIMCRSSLTFWTPSWTSHTARHPKWYQVPILDVSRGHNTPVAPFV